MPAVTGADDTPRPAGVILAGGTGRRLGGRDKALIRLGGRPLAAHVAERLAPQVAAMALNANGDAARFAFLGLPVIPDGSGGQGPLDGLLAGLRWARDSGFDRVVTVAVDTPFFPPALVSKLAAATGPSAPAIACARLKGASASRRHPTFGLWPVALIPTLARDLNGGQRRLGDWAMRQGAIKAEFVFQGDDPFANINRVGDLARAISRMSRPPGQQA